MAFMNKDVERVVRTIFRRCVVCPAAELSCPVCAKDEICSQTIADCNTCPTRICIKIPADGSGINPFAPPEKSHGPNVGAIAGGVVGGIAAIVIITVLVWRFCLKGRRRTEVIEEEWEEEDASDEKTDSSGFTMRRDARASTHTVASLASTVLTRASNIIQIAYIPGVTNRSGPQSPGLLVPPVPPIPIMTTSSAGSSPFPTEDQHFFVPGDLRDSTYSGYTDYSDNRTSIAPSLARSSVATTIYRSNAVVSPMPAQTVVRGKAAVVSVKSSQNNSPVGTPNPDTPPVPQIDPAMIVKGPIKIHMPASSDASGLNPHGSVRSMATMGKPTPLTITKKGKAIPMRSPSNLSHSSSIDGTQSESSTALNTPVPPTSATCLLTPGLESDSDAELEHARSRRSLLRTDSTSTASNARDSQVTEIADTPALGQSPFADMSSSISSPDYLRNSHRGSGLSTVLEGTDDEKSRRSSRLNEGPFGDENAVGRS